MKADPVLRVAEKLVKYIRSTQDLPRVMPSDHSIASIVRTELAEALEDVRRVDFLLNRVDTEADAEWMSTRGDIDSLRRRYGELDAARDAGEGGGDG